MKISSISQNRWLQLAARFTVALTGAMLFIWMLGPACYEIAGFTVQEALRPAASGQTVIELPPFGALTAKTHSSPLEFKVTLLRVEEKVVTSTLTEWNLNGVRIRVKQEAVRVLTAFVLRQLLLGILGAVLSSLFLVRIPIRRIWQPALVGLFAVGAWVGPAYATYDFDAFERPAYSGMIAAAPRILELSQNLVSGFEKLKAHTPEVLANLHALFNRADVNGLPAAGNGKKFLLISDIHNNPVGLAIARELAVRFAVDAVLDAGDLTDFGSPLELNLVEDLTKMGVPYVFAPGNHDSPAVMDFLASKSGVSVLKGKTISVAGISILGAPDPSAYRPEPTASTAAQEQREFEAQVELLEKVLNTSKNPVDVLLVHNPWVASHFIGQVPLIAFGHTHRPAVEEAGSSLLLNPGTTGAAGLRGFQTDKEIPYTAMVVYFDGAKRPAAVDIITYGPREGNFRVERRITGKPKTGYEPLSAR